MVTIRVAIALAAIVLVVLYALSAFVGCANEPLSGSSMIDPTNATCDQIANAVENWIDGFEDCKEDSDCIFLTTGCDLPYQCGVAAGADASGDYLDSLVSEWNERPCFAFCPKCPVGQHVAVCRAGRCEAQPLSG